MLKNFKCRTTLLGIAAALCVCGCSAGSPAEDEAADQAVQAVVTPESESPIARELPTWIGDEAPNEGGFVSAGSCSDGGDWLRDMPVMIHDEKPSGVLEGGMVPTTTVDPDGDGESGQELPEVADD